MNEQQPQESQKSQAEPESYTSGCVTYVGPTRSRYGRLQDAVDEFRQQADWLTDYLFIVSEHFAQQGAGGAIEITAQAAVSYLDAVPGVVTDVESALIDVAAGEHLFPNGTGRRLNRSQVDFSFRQACRRAGVSGFRFHDLRHEYGSRLGDADVNLKKIARLMGHSDTKMTERYVHPDEDSLLAATEAAARPRSRIVPRSLRVVG